MRRLLFALLFLTAPSLASAQSAEPPGLGPLAISGEYRLSGEAALRPSRIGDDGERTYIEWGKYQSLPAVFGIGTNGEEEVVDGYMREGVFTIDRVYTELVFRIDRKRAKARRTQGLGAG
jgi:type IV secretion system protein VirB9